MAYPQAEPVAIIGSACRFPGANSPEELWNLLLRPRDLSKKIPEDRFSAAGFWNAVGSHHGTSNVTHSYFLEGDSRRFDANFFNINPREAASIDPQHRLLLETVYEALESAGLSLEAMCGTNTGVYAGLMCADYLDLQLRDPDTIAQYHATGTARSILSNRVSYFFDWKGPSMTIDTACSSSLVAVHLAVQALRHSECSTAIAAGANLILGPEMYIAESNLHMLSPTGTSQMWDADANGYARGEGIGVVVLKRLGDALRAGDPIECVIRETAVNSDGRTNGITMPLAISQSSLIQETYRKAGLNPLSELDRHVPSFPRPGSLNLANLSLRCQFFEAHGTGTPVGDPLEAEAIKCAFFPDQHPACAEPPRHLLNVGSVKTVIGHTEGAAGIAGLLKASLALQNGVVPPNLHFNRLNPKIAPFYANLHVPTVPLSWPKVEVARASVNSFGFGGTNAHCVFHGVQQLLPMCGSSLATTAQHESPLIFPLSACSQRSLTRLVQRYAAYIAANPSVDLQNVAFTVRSRSALSAKHCFVARSRGSLIEQLSSYTAPSHSIGQGAHAQLARVTAGVPRVLGIFTGQGAQWPTMGRNLILRSPVFAATIERLDIVLGRVPNPPDWCLRDELLADAGSSRCSDSEFSQPLCTAVQIALVDLLHSVGVRFNVVVGHSSGEIAAAYTAGCLSAEEAITVAYYRGYYSHRASSTTGAKLSMMAAGIGFAEALRMCDRAEYKGKIFPAASNAPFSTTISGDEKSLHQALSELASQERFARMLRVDKAYHTPYMRPCALPYLNSLHQSNVQGRIGDPSCTWISSVHGFEMDMSSDPVNSDYWVENLLQPVLFSEALGQAIRDHGPFSLALEVGPHPALKGPTGQNFKALGHNEIPYHGSLTRGEDDTLALGQCLASVWAALGPSAVNLSKLASSLGGEAASRPLRIMKSLPTYPWDHETIHWRESRRSKQYCSRPAPHELLGACTERSEGQICWRNIFHVHEISWLRDHKVHGEVVFPAAGYCVMAIEAAMAFLTQPIRLIELQQLVIHRGVRIEDNSIGTEMISTLSLAPTGNDSRSSPDLSTAAFNFSLTAGKADGTEQFSIRFETKISVTLGNPHIATLPASQRNSAEWPAADVDRFYLSMQEIGLEYTGVFRSMTSCERRWKQASARIAPIPSSMIIHPGFLDTTFQTLFLGMAAPGDESLRTTYLPTKIQSIRVNPAILEDGSPVEMPYHIDTTITDLHCPTQESQASFTGDVDVYSDGNCVIQVEGLACVALGSLTKADDRNMFHTTTWELDILCGMSASRVSPESEYLALLEEYESIARQYVEGRCVSSSTLSSPTSPGEQLIESLHAGRNNHHTNGIENRSHSRDYWQSGVGPQRIRKYLAQTAKQIAHKHPRMTIMQLIHVSDDEGSAVRMILDSLEDSFASYVVTGLSEDVLRHAQACVANPDERVRFDVFDIFQRSLNGNSEQGFDLVIANFGQSPESDKAHQVLNSVRQLLRPGGYVLLQAVTGTGLFPGLILDNLVGHSSGPMARNEATWEKTLRNLGYSGIQSIVYDSGMAHPHCHSLILSQAVTPSLSQILRPSIALDSLSSEEKILIIGGETALGSRVVRELQPLLRSWKNSILILPSLTDIASFDSHVAKHVLCLADFEASIFRDFSPLHFDALQKLFQQPRNVFLVTRGFKQGDPYSSMTVGLARVLRTELPSSNVVLLDVDRDDNLDTAQLATLFGQFISGIQLQSDDTQTLLKQELEMALENGGLYIPRIKHAKDMNERFNSAFRQIPATHQPQLTAQLNVPFEKPVPIRVLCRSSSALMVDDDASYFLCLGKARLGNLEQCVLAFTPSADDLVFLEEPSLLQCNIDKGMAPKVLPAVIGFYISARIQKFASSGRTVIFTNEPLLARALVSTVEETKHISITLATSNLSIALWHESIAYWHPYTATRNIKHLLPPDIDLFINLENEPNSLCDRVLNALSSKCTIRGREHFFSAHARQPQSGLSRSYKEYLQFLWSQYNGHANSLPPATEIESLGATEVCAIEQYRSETLVRRLDARAFFRDDATYFLVGMTGELGHSLARWMVAHGVRYLAIASRSPKPARWYQELEAQGCQVLVLSLDVCDREDLQRVHAQIHRAMPPIAGIVNGAMVLADGAFVNMSYEDFVRVLEPKVKGTENLDQLYSQPGLDFFILLSSTATLIGNSGQSNYSVANMYMQGVARRRQQRGLAGSCVDIGMVLGLGVVTRNVTHEKTLRKAGLLAISETDFHCIFAEAMRVGWEGVMDSPCFSTGLHVPPGQSRPQWYDDPRFAHFHVMEDLHSKSQHRARTQLLQDRLRNPVEMAVAESWIQEAFITMLQKLLQLPCPITNITQPLTQLGIDSLLSTEIKGWFYKELNFHVSVLKLLGGISIIEICREATECFFQAESSYMNASYEPEAVVTNPARNSEQIQEETESYADQSESSSSDQGTSRASQFTPASTLDFTPQAVDDPQSSSTLSLRNLLPLSVEQEKMYFMLATVDDPTMYNCTIQYELHGDLDMERFKIAVIHVAQRHESLRTAFVTQAADGMPRRAILESSQIGWWERTSGDPLEASLEISRVHSHEYDLAKGQSMVISILHTSLQHHIMTFGYHHLIMDGVSWQLLLREFAAAYQDPDLLAPVISQYSAFCDEALMRAASRNDALERSRLLETASPLPLFPFARVSFRQVHTCYETIQVSSQLDAGTSAKVKAVSSRAGATSFHFHVAAIQLLIQKVLDIDKFIMGITNANRDNPRFEKVIGHMVEVVPLRCEPQSSCTFTDLLQDTRARVLAALASPSASQKPTSAEQMHTTECNVAVNYIAKFTQDIRFDQSTLRYLTSQLARQPYDLVFTIRENEDGTMLLNFEAQEYLYYEKDIRILMSLYAQLAEAFSMGTDSRLESYECIAASGMPSLHLQQGPVLDHPWSGCLTKRIRKTITTYPADLAIKDGSGMRLTYETMHSRSLSIMQILLEAGVSFGTPVAVACGPSVDTVCTLLAIWWIGAIYMPVDLMQGHQRLAHIIDASRPAAIVCKGPLGQLETSHIAPVIQLPQVLQPTTLGHQDYADENSPAALLHTSGSTGVPKGVLLSHRNLRCHFNATEQAFPIDRQVVLQHSSHSFDAGLFQILLALLHGGTLVITNNLKEPGQLAELMLREHVSVVTAVPSEYALWIGEAGELLSELGSWRFAFCVGEKLSRATIQAFVSLGLPDLTLINAYGPCETTMACTMGVIDYERVDGDSQSVSIGEPLSSYGIAILNPQLKSVPQGWPGEICIAGAAVALGYLDVKDEEGRFVELDGVRLYRTGDRGRLREDGSLEYLGRVDGDSQLKLRGIRLELDEISNALLQASAGALLDAATIAKGDPDDLYLVSFVVLSRAVEIEDNIDLFIKQLLDTVALPPHAKPAQVSIVTRIPLTSSGKVDRKALGRLPVGQSGSPSEQPVLEIIEQKLLEMWKEYLPSTGLPITRETSFFELGGNSLRLLKLQARIRRVTGISIPITELFQSSTLGEMARLAGTVVTRIRASSKAIDWGSETAIPDYLDQIKPLPTQPNGAVREVLLTGATGYYGRAILEALVEIPSVARIHCIAIRPAPDGSPRQELPVKSSKICLYSGDLSDPTCGLNAVDIDKLTRTVDCVIHNGADVSFVKPYAALRKANVLSTKYLFSLCLACRIPFHYISTASVTSLSERDTFSAASVAGFPPPSFNNDGHNPLVSGYVASKWASEVFLERACARFSDLMPDVHIYRPTSITTASSPHESPSDASAGNTNIIGAILDVSRFLHAVPDTRDWRGYIDLISLNGAVESLVRNITTTRSTALPSALNETSKENDGFSCQIRYMNVCGETRFKASELREFMEASDQAAYLQLPWGVWLEKARAGEVIDAGVADFLGEWEAATAADYWKTSPSSARSPFLLPWLE
ncbi:putative Hybrid PKS-NRPS biosynthetic cluster [Aspergillus niger]|nr:putative Hybrid PKS-NRPS biosynthetic cluster [Aspergillus niger]